MWTKTRQLLKTYPFEHVRAIAVAIHAVVQEHHIHPKLRRLPQKGLAPGAVTVMY